MPDGVLSVADPKVGVKSYYLEIFSQELYEIERNYTGGRGGSRILGVSHGSGNGYVGSIPAPNSDSDLL